MTQEYSFTPTSELMQEWLTKWRDKGAAVPYDEFFATQAAQWGADQELEACCEWLVNEGHEYEHVALRDARRPEPSLKKQALETLCSMQIDPCWINGINTNANLMSKYDIIRRALEQLDD